MRKSIIRVAIVAAGTLLVAGHAIGAAPARSDAAPAASQPSMTFAALEDRAIALGIRPTELKIKGRTAEIEGYDASGRKVEVTIDPRSGAVLNRELDD
jgi:hypothetical protein